MKEDEMYAEGCWERPFPRNPYVIVLLNKIHERREQTRPSGGSSTSEGKDLAVRDTLELVDSLIKYVAGWAIDHQVGLAIEGLHCVVPTPETSENEHYLQYKATVDDHKHEKLGAMRGQRERNEEEESDPQFLRSCLINLIRCNPAGWPDWLCEKTLDGLEALEFGEVRPIFQRVNAANKRDLTDRRLMLQAVAMVRFRRIAYGMKLTPALEEVAEVIATSPETIKSWEGRLKREIPLEVAETLGFAEREASDVAHVLREGRLSHSVDLKLLGHLLYGRKALEKLGRAFRAARTRK